MGASLLYIHDVVWLHTLNSSSYNSAILFNSFGFASLECGRGNRHARFVCFGFASPECGRGNRHAKCARFMYLLQVVVEKKVQRCKGSVELSDFTSKASQQD